MNEAVSLDFDRRPSAIPYMLRGMMPVTRRQDLAPRIGAAWHRHRADPGELAEFSRIAGLPSGVAELPLLYPHTFGFRLAMAILTHPRFPVPIWGVLQTRNHLVQHRPIAVDEPLDFQAVVMHGRAVPKGAEFDLRTTVEVAGTLVWESVVTFFTRGRFGEPEPASPLTRAPSEVGPPAAEWTMRNADHWKFGRFTGDYNGIHLWDWYARRLGFRRALYHPARVLGECLARLPRPAPTEHPRGRLRLDAWLKGPVPHGANVRLHAATTSTTSTFALFAGDERPSIVGRLAALETPS
jgi:acyl dehydratase